MPHQSWDDYKRDAKPVLVKCPLCHGKQQVWSWPVDDPDDKVKLGCPVCNPEDSREDCDHEAAYFMRNGARATCLFCGES